MDCIVAFLASFWPWLSTGPHVVILVIIIVLAWQQGSRGGRRSADPHQPAPGVPHGGRRYCRPARGGMIARAKRPGAGVLPASDPGPRMAGRTALNRLAAAQRALTQAESELTMMEAATNLAEIGPLPATTSRLAEAVSSARMAVESATRALVTVPLPPVRETAPSPVRDKVSRPAREAIPDADGYDLCPDPLKARNSAELVNALRRYRISAGEPSFRDMASNSGQRVAYSTMCAALSGDALPKLDVVLGVVAGCGGSEEDQQRFATAWRRLRIGETGRPDLRILPSTTDKTG